MKFDTEMGSAVGKLSNTLAPMEDYAESLDKYVRKSGTRALRPPNDHRRSART